MIHNLIGQINSNQGRFDRKSIKRHELSFRVRSSHFSLLSVQGPFKHLLRALAIFRNQKKLILSWLCLIPHFLNFPFSCFNWYRRSFESGCLSRGSYISFDSIHRIDIIIRIRVKIVQTKKPFSIIWPDCHRTRTAHNLWAFTPRIKMESLKEASFMHVL